MFKTIVEEIALQLGAVSFLVAQKQLLLETRNLKSASKKKAITVAIAI